MRELLEKIMNEDIAEQDNLYHISEDYFGKTVTMKPRLASYMRGSFGEDIKTPRVSLSTSVMGALAALDITMDGAEFYIYKLTNSPELYVPTEDQVPDVDVTKEVWALSLVELEFISKAKIIYKEDSEFVRGHPQGLSYVEIKEGVGKTLATAAAAGIVGGAAMLGGARKGLPQRAVKEPTTSVAVEEPAEKVSVDMKKIASIESSNDPKAENSRTGARGLTQIMQPTWEEMVEKMGVDWSWDEAFDADKNLRVGMYYMNIEIPRLLRHYNIEDTVENRLVAYNWGVGNLSKVGIEGAPQETVDYIKKYANL